MEVTTKMVIEAAWRDERIPKSAMRLLRALGEMADAGLRRATQDELAYAMERSIPWVRATAAFFQKTGYLKVTRRARNREGTYELSMPTHEQLAYRGCSVWTSAELPPEQQVQPSEPVAPTIAPFDAERHRALGVRLGLGEGPTAELERLRANLLKPPKRPFA